MVSTSTWGRRRRGRRSAGRLDAVHAPASARPSARRRACSALHSRTASTPSGRRADHARSRPESRAARRTRRARPPGRRRPGHGSRRASTIRPAGSPGRGSLPRLRTRPCTAPPTMAARSRMPSRPCPSRGLSAGCGPGPLSRTRTRSSVSAVVELDVDRRSRRVATRVGQGLLDDAVRGELDAGSSGVTCPLHDEPGAGTSGAGAGVVDQVDHFGESRLGCARQERVGVLAQHAEQPAHLAQRVARGLADRGESLGAFGRHARCRQTGGLGLDRDHRDVVGDHVVQLAGDPGSLAARRVLEQASGQRLLRRSSCCCLGPGATHAAHDASDHGEREDEGDVACCGR